MLTLDQIKLKSQSRLAGLHPVLAAAAVALIERCYARGVHVVITQGLRTTAEQNALYMQGRTKPGVIVTNARGGYSYHNFGLAIDFALLLPDGHTVSWDRTRDGDGDKVADWSEVVQEAKALGFGWGGDWTSMKDYPHLDMTFGLSTAELRAGCEPTAAQVQAAYSVIDRLQEEADKLLQAEKQELAALRSDVKELAATVASLTKSKDVLKEQALKQAAEVQKLNALLLNLTDTSPPAWSLEALKAFADTLSVLNGKPVIDTPDKATYTEARLITILYRLGLAGIQKGGE